MIGLFHVQEPFSPAERLAVTLRYLASGDSQTSIGFLFKMGRSTVNRIIEEVCTELCVHLTTTDVQQQLLNGTKFHKVRDMPNCIGTLDGKHIRMRKPADSGSLWHYYKGFFSMVLMAICDARYCFTLIELAKMVPKTTVVF